MKARKKSNAVTILKSNAILIALILNLLIFAVSQYLIRSPAAGNASAAFFNDDSIPASKP